MSKKVALSFSGGKDSCLALYQLQKQGIDIAYLITTVWKKNNETVAHDENRERILLQAERLGVPVHFIETDFETYTEDFVLKLNELRAGDNIDGIAFGDIYLSGHREWGEKVAEAASLEAIYPLWTVQESVLRLLHQFVEVGFEAEVIKVDEARLPGTWVGRKVDESFIKDIIKYDDVCPMGESGEYHTTVNNGPIFKFDSSETQRFGEK